MPQINGKTQIRPNSIPYSAVDSSFRENSVHLKEIVNSLTNRVIQVEVFFEQAPTDGSYPVLPEGLKGNLAGDSMALAFAGTTKINTEDALQFMQLYINRSLELEDTGVLFVTAKDAELVLDISNYVNSSGNIEGRKYGFMSPVEPPKMLFGGLPAAANALRQSRDLYKHVDFIVPGVLGMEADGDGNVAVATASLTGIINQINEGQTALVALSNGGPQMMYVVRREGQTLKTVRQANIGERFVGGDLNSPKDKKYVVVMTNLVMTESSKEALDASLVNRLDELSNAVAASNNNGNSGNDPSKDATERYEVEFTVDQSTPHIYGIPDMFAKSFEVFVNGLYIPGARYQQSTNDGNMTALTFPDGLYEVGDVVTIAYCAPKRQPS